MMKRVASSSEEEAGEIGGKSNKSEGGGNGDINYNPCGETSCPKCPNCRVDGKRKKSHPPTCPISPARLLLAYAVIRKIPGRELCPHVDCDGTKLTFQVKQLEGRTSISQSPYG